MPRRLKQISLSLGSAVLLVASGCNSYTETSQTTAAAGGEAASPGQAQQQKLRQQHPVQRDIPSGELKVGDLAAPLAPINQPSAAARPRRPKKPAVMPAVLMSQGHRETSKVFVGDMLPDAELPDLSGKKRRFSSDYGKKLTLVCFFGGRLSSEEQLLLDLTPEVVDQFDKSQVAVIGIGVGRPTDAVAEQMKKLGVKFPIFVDTDRKAYDAVAKTYLPRIYLIDAAGKILWLDLEYSATTRRQIDEAIRSVLEKK
jgi:peroxiredoxin